MSTNTVPEISDEDLVFSLKNGINLRDVENEGSMFELDPEKDLAIFGQPQQSDYFDKEDVLENLNYQATMGNSSDDSDDSDDALEPFEKILTKMTAIVPDNKVMKKTTKEGYGSVPPKNSQVTIHYNAYLEFSDEPFDSSRLRKQPFRFILDDGKVIVGLNEAVSTMRQTEVAEFLIQSDYAFGSMGCPPRIPAGATVFYVVELLSFVHRDTTVEFEEISEDRKVASFPKVLEICKTENRTANELFNMKQYHRSLIRYNKAARLLSEVNMADENEEEQQKKLLLKLYCNLAQCHLNLNAPDRAIPCALSALKIDNNNNKALFRCGKANRLNGNFAESKHFLKRAARGQPNSEEIIKEIEELNKDIAKHEKLEKEFCGRIFGNSATVSKPLPKLSMSEGFKEDITKNLNDFIASEAEVLPFSHGFTSSEIQAIHDIATELGLRCVIPEHGDVKIKVYKKGDNELDKKK